jgi:hypothetical protein
MVNAAMMPAGMRSARLQQVFGQAQAEQGVGDADAEQAPAAVALPAQGHEQAHGADGDQAAEVIEDVRGVEAGSMLITFAQERPQPLALLGGDDAGRRCGLKVLGFEFHRGDLPGRYLFWFGLGGV